MQRKDGEYKIRVRNVLVKRDRFRRQEKEIQCTHTTNKNWRSKQVKDQKKENLMAAQQLIDGETSDIII